MPHFGLMDERTMGGVEGSLLRARLHIRGGKRRLRQGKIAAGIVTLYDALDAAMTAYAADPAHKKNLVIRDGENLNDSRTLFAVLVRSGVLNGVFDFDSFDRLTEQALVEEMPGYEYRGLLSDIESVMNQLGIMPFDEASLPPEDPATF